MIITADHKFSYIQVRHNTATYDRLSLLLFLVIITVITSQNKENFFILSFDLGLRNNFQFTSQHKQQQKKKRRKRNEQIKKVQYRHNTPKPNN